MVISTTSLSLSPFFLSWFYLSPPYFISHPFHLLLTLFAPFSFLCHRHTLSFIQELNVRQSYSRYTHRRKHYTTSCRRVRLYITRGKRREGRGMCRPCRRMAGNLRNLSTRTSGLLPPHPTRREKMCWFVMNKSTGNFTYSYKENNVYVNV